MDNGNEIGIRDSILKFVTSLLYLARTPFPLLPFFVSLHFSGMK